MTPTTDPNFEAWLTAATQGLPKHIATQIRIELTDHHEDAIAAYRERGYATEAAQAAALRDLGEAQTVRRMFCRVHLSPTKRFYSWLTWLAPQLWQHRETIATALFGLLALIMVVGDHRHWISYRGHLDPLTPLSLIFVIASLILERKLAVWSYPALGYVLTGVWPWAFLSLFPLRNSFFWNILAPLLLPIGTLLGLAILGLSQLRHRQKRRIQPYVWLLIVLTVAAGFGMTTVQIVETNIEFRRSALDVAQITVNAPWVLYIAAMLLSPVAIGLLGARRHGIAAVLIPLACLYSIFVGIADPTYHLTFYDAVWQPSRTLHLAEALVTYMPALTTFLVTPLLLLRAQTKAQQTQAVLIPTIITLVCAQILSALGLQHTPEAYTGATWVSSGFEVLQFILPVVLAVVLYRQFPTLSNQYIPAGSVTPPNSHQTTDRTHLWGIQR